MKYWPRVGGIVGCYPSGDIAQESSAQGGKEIVFWVVAVVHKRQLAGKFTKSASESKK